MTVAEMMKFLSPASVAVMVCASDARSQCWSVFSLAESFLHRRRSVRQPPKACNMVHLWVELRVPREPEKSPVHRDLGLKQFPTRC